MAAPRRRVLFLLVLLALAAGTYVLVGRVSEQGTALEKLLRDEQLRGLANRRAALWGKYDETGFERMGVPREGEWLARFPEQGQTFDDYKGFCSNKRRAGRETIALRPFGPLSARARAALEPVRRFTEAFFDTKTVLLDESPLPEAARNEDQFDVTPLLACLKAETRDEDLVHAGILDKDLSWKGQVPNFVFGGASFKDRVGVYSLERFGRGERRESVYRLRAFKLVAHELGHILSLAHCVYYSCLMNGANSLPETDASPCHVCPVCREKLAWNLGFDPGRRAAALAAVFRAEGIEDEARWIEAHR
jgi:archaemetzincin